MSPKELLPVSRQWALELALHQKPWISSLRRTDRIGSLSEAREIIKAARQHANRIAPNMPQHKACLDAIEEGVISGGYAGVLKVFMKIIIIYRFHLVEAVGWLVISKCQEEKLFKELVLSSTSKGLVHVFFAQRMTSKVSSCICTSYLLN